MGGSADNACMDADPKSAPSLRAVGGALARFLAQPRHVHGTSAAVDLGALAGMLRPADVILVEGNSRFSTAVRYLTQSTWSHAALYVGDRLGSRDGWDRVVGGGGHAGQMRR